MFPCESQIVVLSATPSMSPRGQHITRILPRIQVVQEHSIQSYCCSIVQLHIRNSINSASVQLYSRNISTNTINTANTKHLRALLGRGTKRSTSL